MRYAIIFRVILQYAALCGITLGQRTSPEYIPDGMSHQSYPVNTCRTRIFATRKIFLPRSRRDMEGKPTVCKAYFKRSLFYENDQSDVAY